MASRSTPCEIYFRQFRRLSRLAQILKAIDRLEMDAAIEQQLLPHIHPGEILLEEFLQPMNISQYRLAKDTGVPAKRINEIVHGRRGISADTAVRLSRYFGLSERFWMNLQSRYELERSRTG